MRLKGWLDWAVSPLFLAQSAHFGWAMAIISLPYTKGVPLWLIWVIGVPIVAFKEFYIDMKLEDSATIKNQTVDFIFYMFGALIATIIIWS